MKNYLEMIWGAKNTTLCTMIEKYLEMNPKAKRDNLKVCIFYRIFSIGTGREEHFY